MTELLPNLLTAAADRWPEHPAVVMDDRTLSYEELETLSNRLARVLADRGIGHGDRVALWLPKCPEAVAAIYGIMKAGAAYVSIDPAAPPVRVGYIARDCQIAALITVSGRRASLEREFGSDAPMRMVVYADSAVGAPCIGSIPAIKWSDVVACPRGPVQCPAAASSLAYILYTSGSTGQPKGVAIPHRSSLSFVEWASATFEINHEDRLANHAGFHFDLSTFDLYAAARAGATVFPVAPRLSPFPAALARQWSKDRLTVWYATPSTLILLLAHGELGSVDLSSLRVVLFAGEVFPAKHLRHLMELAPQARFANLYGPTETNVCTWYQVDSAPADDLPLPIGRACPNCEAFILDEDLRPVERGAVGELWIGGGTLMRGYFNRAEQTAKVLCEIETAAGSRTLAYRTGDLVREHEDGLLQFVGRRDHQIKTRGYRVELGEIEIALSGHPSVDQAVVLAIPAEEIGHRLAAVVVANPGAVPDIAELKRHCAQLLPRYMVPETIEVRSSLPRTASDKVDREALLRMFSVD